MNIDKVKKELNEQEDEEPLKQTDIDNSNEKIIEKTNEQIFEDTKETTVKTAVKATAVGNTRGSGTNPDDDPLATAISASYKAEKRTRQFAENDFKLDGLNGSLNVIMETGGMTYECTEHVIHGKNGFEFPIKRIYDTDVAKRDCPSIAELVREIGVNNSPDAAWLLGCMGCSMNIRKVCEDNRKGYSISRDKVKEVLMKKGDATLSIGAGWRLDLPYVDKDEVLHLTGGRVFLTENMQTTYYVPYATGFDKCDAWENHKGDDFIFMITRKIEARDSRGAPTAWKSISCELIEKNGTIYLFNGDGKLTKIKDPSNTNEITISYESDGRIKDITAPFGDKLKFTYGTVDKYICPVISKISFVDAGGTETSSINYTYKKLTAEKGDLNPYPLLEKTTDKAGRTSSYSYQRCTSENGLGIYAFYDSNMESNYIRSILYTLENYKTCSGDYKEIVGLETPELMTGVTNALGFIQTIGYGKETVSLIPSEAGAYTPTKKQRVMVKSVVDKNGSNILGRYYSYTQKLHANFQIFVSSVTMTENQRRTVTNYTEKKTEDRYIPHMSSRVLWIPLDKGSDLAASSTSYQWNNDRISKETTTAGKNICEITYSYDNWGNIKIESVTKKTGAGTSSAKVSERITKSKYYNTSSGSISGFPGGVQSTPEQSVKGTRSLLVNQEVTYKTDSEITCKVQKGYAYDKYGRCIWEGIYNGNHWGKTQYSYYEVNSSNGKKGGLLMSRTAPSGQAYSYSYTISGSELTESITALNVDIGKGNTSGSGKYITTKKIIYTQTGLVKSNTDGNGNTTSYTYDGIGRKIKETTPDGISVIRSYSDASRLITVVKNGYPNEAYQYDTKGNIIKYVRYNRKGTNEGNYSSISETFAYNEEDKITSYTDERGNCTGYTYDVLGRVLKTTNPDGTYSTREYDDSNNRVKVTDEEGHTYNEYVNFDGKVWLTEKYIGYPGGYERITSSNCYDTDGREVKTIDAAGYKTKTYWSPFGSIVSRQSEAVSITESSIQKSVYPLKRYEYSDEGLIKFEYYGYTERDTDLLSNTNHYMRSKKHTYNESGWILKEEEYGLKNQKTYSKRSSEFEYDNSGNVTREKHEDGTCKSYGYDSMNRVSSVTDECGGITTFEYNHDGKLTKKTDPNGFVYLYEYDDFNRLIKADLPPVPGKTARNVTTVKYDKCGNVTEITEPDGRKTVRSYDVMNRIISETVKHGSGTEEVKTEKGWSYYANGSIKKEITGGVTDNGSSAVTTYTYDVVGRLIKKTYPDGKSEQYTKDNLDRITQITYVDGSDKKLEYNSLSYVTKETDEENYVTEHEYDVWGEETVRSVRDADGNVLRIWKTNYTVFGAPDSEESGDGRTWSYSYNNRWQLSEKTDPKGIKQILNYDGCGRMTGAEWNKGDSTQSRSYVYDPAGFLKSGTDGSITTEFNLSGSTYNANAYGLVTGCKTTAGSKVLVSAFSYDEGKRLKETVYPDSVKVVFGYNGIGLLKTVGNTGSATAYASTGTYDTAGHLTSMKGGNSLTRTESWNKTKGHLESYSWGISGKAANTLAWNNRGNITSQKKNEISYTYQYDKKDQLKEEKKGTSQLNTWTYDANGNRITEKKNGGSAQTLAYYNKSDLVKTDGTWKYNYDANGNMTYKGKTATAKTGGGLFEGWTFNATSGEVWKYEYDLCNRLIKVKHSTAGTNSLTQVAEYKYDLRDLMVCRTTGSVSEYFAYDAEGKLIYMEKGTEKHEYVYANGKLWCEVVTTGSTKNTYYHHSDHLGTTVCITNSGGTVVWQCEKDAFGHVRNKTNSSFTPNFTGKLLDQNTGLYYFNARWYDPDMGRFITEDPARDGRNWFVYCRNNPLINVDFNGKEAGDLFNNADDAAKDFAMTYNDDSIKKNIEIGTYIRKKEDKYFYDIPISGTEGHLELKRSTSEHDIVGMIHTHGAYFKPYKDEKGFVVSRDLGFSDKDLQQYRNSRLPSYVVVSSGEMFVVDDINNKGEYVIGTFKPIFPSDPNCPTRKSSLNAYDLPDNNYIQKEARNEKRD